MCLNHSTRVKMCKPKSDLFSPRDAAQIPPPPGKEFLSFSFSLPPLTLLLRRSRSRGILVFGSIDLWALPNMSGRAALEALVASQDRLDVSSAHAAEISAGVRGVLRSTADGDDSATVSWTERDRKECAAQRHSFFTYSTLASFFACLFSMTASARDVDVAFRRAQAARKRR